MEAKAILSGLQEQLVRQQLAEYLHEHRSCPGCHRLRAIKGYHPLRFRSALGRFTDSCNLVRFARVNG